MKRTISIVMAVAVFVSWQAHVQAQSWSQWQGDQRDGIWRETGIMTSFPEDGPKLVWQAEVAAGYSGPAVADGRVFLMDYEISSGDDTPNAGAKNELEGQERITCFDMKSGEQLWQHTYDCKYNMSYPNGPRATPTVDGDRVYTLGGEGHLLCLNAKTGDLVWEKSIKDEYGLKLAPHWGFAAHPLIDGDTLYCLAGGEGSVAVALDKMTGKEKWRALSAKEQGYCPPTMIEAGGTKQLLVWHPESLNSLNPQTGEVYWSFPMKPAYNMSIIAPIKHDDYLFATALRGTSILLKLGSTEPTAEEVWRGKGLHPDHNPPLIEDGHMYGVDEQGHIRCFDLQTGERKWESLAAAHNGRPANSTTGFMVKNDDRYFIATEQGDLIMAKMDPTGFEELGRFNMLKPTSRTGNRDVVWSHPAFANKCVFARNDNKIVCYSLADE